MALLLVSEPSNLYMHLREKYEFKQHKLYLPSIRVSLRKIRARLAVIDAYSIDQYFIRPVVNLLRFSPGNKSSKHILHQKSHSSASGDNRTRDYVIRKPPLDCWTVSSHKVTGLYYLEV